MLQTPRLGAPAFASLNVHAEYQWGVGWTLRVNGRREGATEFERVGYELLGTAELLDVVSESLAGMLGL